MTDLRDELLLPLGSLVLPAGLRAGHAAGTLTIRGEGEPLDVELVPGGLELVDLLPGSGRRSSSPSATRSSDLNQ